MGRYRLVAADKGSLTVIYGWIRVEPHRERYTCRPVSPLPGRRTWVRKTLQQSREGVQRTLVLIDDNEPATPLGRGVAFDYNPRNRSIEFGYYLPEPNRGRGLGTHLARLLVDHLFADRGLSLNKVYATTAANNTPSVRILEALGFHLEGEQREHYWVDGTKQSQRIYSFLREEWERMSRADREK